MLGEESNTNQINTIQCPTANGRKNTLPWSESLTRTSTSNRHIHKFHLMLSKKESTLMISADPQSEDRVEDKLP